MNKPIRLMFTFPLALFAVVGPFAVLQVFFRMGPQFFLAVASVIALILAWSWARDKAVECDS